MNNNDTELTARVRRFGHLLYQRARGEVAEMESAKAASRILARHYRPGMTLLDVGCGCGHYLPSLRKRLDENIHYRGVDSTPHYIDLARRAFPDEDLFQVADAKALPFADRSVDLVMCINVLPNLPPPPSSVLSELIRVARRFVLIRTLFAELNYIIRELDPGDGEEAELIAPDGQIALEAAIYNNMYTETYYRSLIDNIDPALEPIIEADGHEQPIAGNAPGGTRTVGEQQVAGPLLLDWRFISIPVTGSRD